MKNLLSAVIVLLALGGAALGTLWRDFFRRLGDVIRYHRAYIRAVGELSALDDRELRDIGTSRSCIRWIAQQTALETTSATH